MSAGSAVTRPVVADELDTESVQHARARYRTSAAAGGPVQEEDRQSIRVAPDLNSNITLISHMDDISHHTLLTVQFCLKSLDGRTADHLSTIRGIVRVRVLVNGVIQPRNATRLRLSSAALSLIYAAINRLIVIVNQTLPSLRHLFTY
jgi:hypothetical protein